MELRNLGNSGLQLPVVGLGTNNFGGRIDKQQSAAVVAKALELGVNFFDTADVYGNRGGSEEALGEALKGHRHEAIIGTKFASPMGEGPYLNGASRRYIMQAVDASLRRLGTDYIDLYQVHFPDQRTPIEETLRTLDDVVRAGKVRYIGCSNFTGWQIADASWTARTDRLTPFVSAQNQYSLLERRPEREVLPACKRFGLGLLPFFPLASGFLTGKYRQGEPLPEGTRLANAGPMANRVLTEENFGALGKLESFAQQRGKTILDLAMGWLASNEQVTSIIAGATRPEQVEQNVRSSEWRLTKEEMAEVSAMTRA